ncbi:MAG TPA: ATP-binding cassette domain-containing protein [Sphingomicrobium sp.]|nr:ATP-binding cassette domain-containing protein [Sphingomicrobium sp.]
MPKHGDSNLRIAPVSGQDGHIPAVVSAERLGRQFGAINAVSSVSFEVSAAETFALIGPNGAGKSTLMKMLTTLLPPTSGTALVAGYDIKRQPGQVRRHIGYVPQLPSADTELTGAENLLLSARLYLIPPAERPSRIAEAVAMMELSDAINRSVHTYSGGMLRRLEIAQSMLHRPAVLFLDEPTIGLDPNGRLAVWQHVQQLKEEIGTAIVFTTHYMDEAEEIADRVALVNEGRLVAIGDVDELLGCYNVNSLDALFTSLTGAKLAQEAGPR